MLCKKCDTQNETSLITKITVYFLFITVDIFLHLGSIYTCDLLGVNCCVNYSLNNGLYCTKWAHLFVWTEKINNGLFPFFVIAWIEKFTQ